MVDHDETRSSSHFPNSVGASCFAGENLSTSTQSHDYASNKVETVGQFETNLVQKTANDNVQSNMAIQDSTKEHICQVFLPESNNDFESEVETDSDYNPWEIQVIKCIAW